MARTVEQGLQEIIGNLIIQLATKDAQLSEILEKLKEAQDALAAQTKDVAPAQTEKPRLRIVKPEPIKQE